MFEVPKALEAHIKKVIKKRKDPNAGSDEPDWDDDDYERNELVDELNWR